MSLEFTFGARLLQHIRVDRISHHGSGKFDRLTFHRLTFDRLNIFRYTFDRQTVDRLFKTFI